MVSQTHESLRAGVIGSLCSLDLIMTEGLKRHGVIATAIRAVSERRATEAELELFPTLTVADVHFYESSRSLLAWIRPLDFVFSYGAALGFALRQVIFAYPLLERLGWPPYMHIGTGSDMYERAVARTLPGLIQRTTMRHAFVAMVQHYPESIKAAARLRMRNACILPPLQLASVSEPSSVPSRCRREPGEKLMILHASNLDWGETDSGLTRKSRKRNDLFLEALARFVETASGPIHVLMLDRGPDRDVARRLISSLGIDHIVEWCPPQTRSELQQLMRSVDVVVDQFEVGALGMIAWEAMTAGRPVLTYTQSTAQKLIYDENPPVLAARSVDEIVERLRQAVDPSYLSDLGARARAWTAVRNNDLYVPRYLVWAVVATGIQAINLDWTQDGIEGGRAVGVSEWRALGELVNALVRRLRL